MISVCFSLGPGRVPWIFCGSIVVQPYYGLPVQLDDDTLTSTPTQIIPFRGGGEGVAVPEEVLGLGVQLRRLPQPVWDRGRALGETDTGLERVLNCVSKVRIRA